MKIQAHGPCWWQMSHYLKYECILSYLCLTAALLQALAFSSILLVSSFIWSFSLQRVALLFLYCIFNRVFAFDDELLWKWILKILGRGCLSLETLNLFLNPSKTLLCNHEVQNIIVLDLSKLDCLIKAMFF